MAIPKIETLLGRRKAAPHNPNISDAGSKTSIEISNRLFDSLGIEAVGGPEAQTAGSMFEIAVRDYLAAELSRGSTSRTLSVQHPGMELSSFDQYSHLAMLRQIIENDDTNTLSVVIGRDYEIRPDVTVSLETSYSELPHLHASVSCKFTLRSDRAQNVRQEATFLTKHRRGRLPHIVAVTLEPMPTRILSLARGTGDIDAVYHVALDELTDAVVQTGKTSQIAALEEMVGQRRLLSLSSLPGTMLV